MSVSTNDQTFSFTTDGNEVTIRPFTFTATATPNNVVWFNPTPISLVPSITLLRNRDYTYQDYNGLFVECNNGLFIRVSYNKDKLCDFDIFVIRSLVHARNISIKRLKKVLENLYW